MTQHGSPDDLPAGLTCYIQGQVFICEACDRRNECGSHPAAQLAWSLHVLLEHWEQAGYDRARRDAMLTMFVEAMP